MAWYHPRNLLDKIFEGSIIIKGIGGLLEFIGGLLVFFINPTQIHNFIALITQRELLEDPRDIIANLLTQVTSGITADSRTFIIAFLWVHASIKLIAVIGLLRNQLWAYPFSLITLGLLMIYQMYDIIFVKISVGMILLTIFDIFILWLIWQEFQKVRQTK